MLSARQPYRDEALAGRLLQPMEGRRQSDGERSTAALDDQSAAPKSKQQVASAANGNRHDHHLNDDDDGRAGDRPAATLAEVVAAAAKLTPVAKRDGPAGNESNVVGGRHSSDGRLVDIGERIRLLTSGCDGEDEEQQQQRENDGENGEPDDERTSFIGLSGDTPKGQQRGGVTGSGAARKGKPASSEQQRRAQLAKQESITERGPLGADQGQVGKAREKTTPGGSGDDNDDRAPPAGCCSRMLSYLGARRCLIIPLLILVIYIAAIYCLPFVDIKPEVPNELPAIPFDFNRGPLQPSSASAFKINHLFRDQIHGPESLAFDSQGNAYMAVEGGFILYAHLNQSSPMKRAYLEPLQQMVIVQDGQLQRVQTAPTTMPKLVKIAELNGLRQAGPRPRAQRADELPAGAGWRRECQLDEKVYGPQLFAVENGAGFRSNVRVSRCSKPLGIRLSADESQLYVIDTLTGLYRINLRAAERQRGSTAGGAAGGGASGQRQVTKLVDFRANNGHLILPAIQLEDESEEATSDQPATRLMNVSMRALDDLVLDTTPDKRDLIYMTVASQRWPATSFVFDALEGRSSGLLLRYNTANNQLVVLEPSRVAHVRTSPLRPEAEFSKLNKSLFDGRSHQPSFMLGAPRLDEEDTFDDRPLNFPNGLELTDDRQALLIADTSNKRIVRYHLRGPRRGTSDLWAWTPMMPDNIRRGYDKGRETYWVVGCGRAPGPGNDGDLLALLRTWPKLRKFLLKNIYFMGYLVEFFGENLLRSRRIQDAGYELRTGSSLCASGCKGMMIVQYNRWGDVIRSIHSREFPNDLYYYSQVNELIDSQNQEHALYLGSPSYSYLTKLTLPTETLPTENHRP